MRDLDKFDINLANYEVILIIDNNRETICITDSLEEANEVYEYCIKKYCHDNQNNHIIIFIYDFNKLININYYDNKLDSP